MHKFSGTSPACSTVYARAGVLGNPADLFGGETIALTFSNFKTIVTLESNTQCILEIDGSITKFSNLLDLEEALRDTQKQLAINLLGASLNRFIRIMGGAKHLLSRGDYSNFHLHFDSNIPRQAGLSGSSAIIIGTLRSLCRFYDVDMTRHQISELALDIETKDLGITAGPMDRVIQTYGGSRHLIFSTERKFDGGEILSETLFPPLFIAWNPHPGRASGKVHHDIFERWTKGDETVQEKVRLFSALVKRGVSALKQGDWPTFFQAVDANFDTRASLWSIDDVDQNLIAIGRSQDAAVKLCGSGGAVIGFMSEETNRPKLEEAYRRAGFNCLKPTITCAEERWP